MKKIFILLFTVTLFASCAKEQTGSELFWTNSTSFAQITVVVSSGDTKTITQAFTTYNPDCSSSGCAKFILPVGAYTFTASDGSYTWSGSFTIVKNGCGKFLLQ